MTRNPETTEAARKWLEALVVEVEDDPALHATQCDRFYIGSDDCTCDVGPVTDFLRERLVAVLAVSPAVTEGERAGADLIAAERRRQIEAEGWTPDHDQHHDQGELARAAAWYAMPLAQRVESDIDHPLLWPAGWVAKPSRDGANESRVRELVKAGALIAAEIDRLRDAQTGSPNVQAPTLGALPPSPAVTAAEDETPSSRTTHCDRDWRHDPHVDVTCAGGTCSGNSTGWVTCIHGKRTGEHGCGSPNPYYGSPTGSAATESYSLLSSAGTDPVTESDAPVVAAVPAEEGTK